MAHFKLGLQSLRLIEILFIFTLENLTDCITGVKAAIYCMTMEQEKSPEMPKTNCAILMIKGTLVGCVPLPKRGSVIKQSFKLRGPLTFVEILGFEV